MNKDKPNGYISQTALDYDMSYEEVEDIYEESNSVIDFHEKLELFIKTRQDEN